MAKSKTAKEKANTYILLDRSASMRERWDEAVSSINAYVDELNKTKEEGAVTVAVFDAIDGVQFDVLREAVENKKYKPIEATEASPRGNTPLYDAVARLLALADKTDTKKNVIIIMTDGEENSSREKNREQTKKDLEAVKAKDWEVIFLGADFDAYHGTAVHVNVAVNKTMSMNTGMYETGMRGLANLRNNYTISASANIDTMSLNAIVFKK